MPFGRVQRRARPPEESFILAADEVARVLIAERCPAFLDTYYRKQYRPAAGSTLTRLRRPGEPRPG